MDKAIDFDPVARWYDLYANPQFDLAFWVDEARRHPGARAELMCGTGRISLALLRAGLALACADYSAGMLAQLRRKLAAEGLRAPVVRADARRVPFRGLDWLFIGFHAFAELARPEDQAAALASARRALRPGGCCSVSLQNPVVRGPQHDGRWRPLGSPELPEGGRLAVEGRYLFDPATFVVTGSQRYHAVDARGRAEDVEVPLRFRLLPRAEFERLARGAGFEILELLGDYERRPFDEAASPFLLYRLRAA